MPHRTLRSLALRGFLITFLLLFATAPSRGQGTASPTSGSADLASEVRTLSETVRQLQEEVGALKSQMQEMRPKDASRESSSSLELDSAQPVPKSSSADSAENLLDPYLTFPNGQPSGVTQPNSASAPNGTPATRTLEERLAQLEDDDQLTESKLDEQDQTKVESGSKYRLRLSGIVLLNLFENRGVVDNADLPEIALESNPLASAGTFGGSLRQSQIELQAFGPGVGGARTRADIKFDFGGGFPAAPNGSVLGLVRLRTGTVRLDWSNTSIVAGQDFLFFAPLEPTSLAQFAIPALSYAGNLWGWTPQVRIEHRLNFSERSSVLFAAGILDSLTGDLPYSQYERYPSWGEESGQPAYAARIAWSGRILNQNFTVAQGGYYGRQYWGFGRHIDGWVSTTDFTMPFGKYVTFSGEFYRGRATGGLGGGIGQSVLLAEPVTSPGPIRGLDSMGGWAQLKYKPFPKFEINAALGDDNPFSSEFRLYPASDSYYGVNLIRNFSPFANFIYQLRSDVLFSVEYRHLKTYQFEDGAYSATQMNVSLGYIF